MIVRAHNVDFKYPFILHDPLNRIYIFEYFENLRIYIYIQYLSFTIKINLFTLFRRIFSIYQRLEIETKPKKKKKNISVLPILF